MLSLPGHTGSFLLASVRCDIFDHLLYDNGDHEDKNHYICLCSHIKVITKANNTLNSISSSSVCTEVIQSAQGMEYLLGEELQTTHTHTHMHSRHYKQAGAGCIS